jgi:alkanesulfonate monooxygenase SsuD/methylene tetrahydromethanopterin reductase-like flavin-dependent oxidoreductase (luciferase family)
MKVQILLQAGLPAVTVARLGSLAENFGVDTLWASSFPGHRDPFLSLSILARDSQRMRLGVVPISPFEMHPMRISDALLTLNEMCGGRASLLVGGLGRSVMRVTGLEPTRRVTAVSECVEILKSAARGDLVEYTGDIYRLHGYQASWTADAPPSIYVGATGPSMLKMAGRVADGVMMSDVPLSRMPEVLGNVRLGIEGAERDESDFRFNNFFAWHIKPDRKESIAEARRELVWRGILQKWHTSPFLGEADSEFVESNWGAFLQAFFQQTEVIEGIPEHIVEALVANLTFSGGLDAIDGVIEHLKSFEAAGLDEITLKVHGDADEAIRIIGERLVPELN